MEYCKQYNLPSTIDSINLAPIQLLTKFDQLVPVTVLHIKPLSIKADTLEYHADAYFVRPGAELDLLLKKA